MSKFDDPREFLDAIPDPEVIYERLRQNAEEARLLRKIQRLALAKAQGERGRPSSQKRGETAPCA